MNWQDEGILVLKRKYSENANIVSLLTQNHGKNKWNSIWGKLTKN